MYWLQLLFIGSINVNMNMEIYFTRSSKIGIEIQKGSRELCVHLLKSSSWIC